MAAALAGVDSAADIADTVLDGVNETPVRLGETHTHVD